MLTRATSAMCWSWAGSRGMSGAAVLCGRAGSSRRGRAPSRSRCPEVIQTTVAAGEPCCTTAGLPSDSDNGQIAAHGVAGNCWDLRENGPTCWPRARGWPRRGATVHLDRAWQLHDQKRGCLSSSMPTALTRWLHWPEEGVVTGGPDDLDTASRGVCPADRGKPAEVQANRELFALSFAAERGVVLVLKGAGTLVTDGRRLYVNRTGNPGMATGGSGDVLTGLIAALLGGETRTVRRCPIRGLFARVGRRFGPRQPGRNP